MTQTQLETFSMYVTFFPQNSMLKPKALMVWLKNERRAFMNAINNLTKQLEGTA